MKKLPRVAAAHDLSGFGKCALTVAIPVLSACGVEVRPLPTAILAAHTGLEHFTLFDFTGEMADYLACWKKLSLHFDAFYSGFLGSEAQIDMILDFLEHFDVGVVLIDPVMGDHGRVYQTYTPQMCQGMRRLVSKSDLVTPNLTEACILTDTPYDQADTSASGIKALAEQIHALGAKQVVITGIARGDDLVNCIYDQNGYSERSTKRLPFAMHGSGDLFASVLVGGLVTGHSLDQSVDSAAAFVAMAMQQSLDYEDYDRRGICFEPSLHLLSGGIYHKDQ